MLATSKEGLITNLQTRSLIKEFDDNYLNKALKECINIVGINKCIKYIVNNSTHDEANKIKLIFQKLHNQLINEYALNTMNTIKCDIDDGDSMNTIKCDENEDNKDKHSEFNDLPNDMITSIICYLDKSSIIKMKNVSLRLSILCLKEMIKYLITIKLQTDKENVITIRNRYNSSTLLETIQTSPHQILLYNNKLCDEILLTQPIGSIYYLLKNTDIMIYDKRLVSIPKSIINSNNNDNIFFIKLSYYDMFKQTLISNIDHILMRENQNSYLTLKDLQNYIIHQLSTKNGTTKLSQIVNNKYNKFNLNDKKNDYLLIYNNFCSQPLSSNKRIVCKSSFIFQLNPYCSLFNIDSRARIGYYPFYHMFINKHIHERSIKLKIFKTKNEWIQHIKYLHGIQKIEYNLDEKKIETIFEIQVSKYQQISFIRQQIANKFHINTSNICLYSTDHDKEIHPRLLIAKMNTICSFPKKINQYNPDCHDVEFSIIDYDIHQIPKLYISNKTLFSVHILYRGTGYMAYFEYLPIKICYYLQFKIIDFIKYVHKLILSKPYLNENTSTKKQLKLLNDIINNDINVNKNDYYIQKDTDHKSKKYLMNEQISFDVIDLNKEWYQMIHLIVQKKVLLHFEFAELRKGQKQYLYHKSIAVWIRKDDTFQNIVENQLLNKLKNESFHRYDNITKNILKSNKWRYFWKYHDETQILIPKTKEKHGYYKLIPYRKLGYIASTNVIRVVFK